MSLHNFNSNNKSWKMYTNTLSSISGDDLTIKPYDGKNISLEVSGNNAIFIKKGDLSYNLSNLITGTGTGTGTGTTITSGSDASFSNIDVSGNLNPLNTNGSSIGLATKNWRNAYMRDVSVSNIDVSINLNPLITNNSTLGSSTKIWRNAYIRDVSITNLDVSGNLNPFISNNSSLGILTKNWSNAYIRDLSVSNIDVSGNIIPLITNNSSLGLSNKIWGNAYIRDLSVNNIDVSGNLNPLFGNTFSLGSSTKVWNNAYIRDISVSSLEVSGNLYPLITNNSSLGSSLKVWKNVFVDDICLNKINGATYSAGGGGGSIVLTSITSNIVPSITNTYSLGTTTNYWSNAYIRDVKVSNRAYQEISGDISWSAVNGYYGLAKDAYPSLDPSSSGVKAVKTWTGRVSSNEANTWRNVCWSKELGIFVAVADQGSNKVMTSPNGINWTGRTSSNESNYWVSVCWSPELKIFVAVAYGGSNRVMTSPDGTNWTGKTSARESNGWHSVCWSPELGIFVSVAYAGSNKVMTSRDGSNWNLSSYTGGDGNSWYGVCWSPHQGLFAAVAEGGTNKIMTSSNGTTWTAITTAPTSGWTGVCWSGELGLFVGVAFNGSKRVVTSSDGKTWTAWLSSNEGAEWFSVCWSPQLASFAAVSFSGIVMTSHNGINWTTRTAPTSGGSGVCWSPELGIFAAVAWSGGNRVLTSSLRGRPPSSYNVFDNTFNSIDETGKWTFQNILTQQLTVNTTVYSSDDRVKHNEVIINNGLAIIDQLTPKFYQKTLTMLDASYNGDLSGHAWTYEAGLIAQEVLQIRDLSFAVSGGDFYEYVMNYDVSGADLSGIDLSYNDISSIALIYNDLSSVALSYNDVSGAEPSKHLIKQVYNINYNSIFVYGIAAIKELHAKVKTQETNTLDEQLNNLIARIETLEH